MGGCGWVGGECEFVCGVVCVWWFSCVWCCFGVVVCV